MNPFPLSRMEPSRVVESGDPYEGETSSVKVGEHQAGREIDPDHRGPVDRAVLDRGREVLGAYAKERFPGFRIKEAGTCLYTNTGDEDFVLDRQGPIVVGSPCSGHGFKFAPLIGRILADLATGETPPVDLARFALRRASLLGAGS